MQIKLTLPTELLKKKLLERITLQREDMLGYVFEYDGHAYDADLISLLNLICTLLITLLGLELPADFTWRTADNQDIPHTKESLTNLAISMWVARSQVYKKSFIIKNAIKDSDNPEYVKVKDWWKNDSVQSP